MMMKECQTIRLTETDSTNRYALDLLSAGPVAEGTLVVADSQTAGRGMDGSVWESAPGSNLTFSMVIYPNYISVDYQFYLNKAVSLGVYDLVRKIAGDVTRIKWPNDIYFNHGKIAGILIQNGIQGSKFSHCVAGVGLNVNQDRFSHRAANPVSLKLATGREFELDPLLEELCASIRQRLEMLRAGQTGTLDRDYLSSLYRLNEMAGFIYNGEEIMAKITGVNRYGHLILEIPSHKIIECDLKEIRFII